MSIFPIIPLKNIANICSGITLGRKPTGQTLLAVSYLRVANVQDGRLDLKEVKTVEATPGEIEKWKLLKGDLLLTEGGDLDKLGRGTFWNGELPLCIHQNHIFRVRLPEDRYDPLFVSFQIGSNYGKSYFLAHAKKTTGIASINQQVLGAFPLLSPPLEDQRRIASRLKAQLAAIEEARNAAQTQLEDSLKLIPAILKAAFTETTHAEKVKIGDVARTTSGTTPSRDHREYWQPAEYPWVKTGEITFEPIKSTAEKVSAKALKECSLSLLPIGTVLVAMYGQGKTRGQSAVLATEATTNQACFAILPNSTFDPEYLQLWLRHSYEDLRGISDARGGNQSNLNGNMLNQFEVPLLSREKQQHIVKQIKAAITEAQILQNTLHQQRAEINLLPSKILAKAFEYGAKQP